MRRRRRPSPEPTGEGLEGRTFLSTGAEGRALVAGSTVRLAFEDGQVSASAGCNSMGGPYRIEGDRLVAGQLMTTEMACDPALMEQDRWLADLLGGSTIALDGDTLTLTGATIRLTLVDREVADPDRPLLGTRWVVEGLVSAGAVSSVPVGVTAALTFSDGRVDVEAGCNEGGGAVQVTDTTLVLRGDRPDEDGLRPRRHGRRRGGDRGSLRDSRLHDRGRDPDARCRRRRPHAPRSSLTPGGGDAASSAGRGRCSAPGSAAAIAARCAGVEPQQAPMIVAPAARTSSA